MALLVRRLPGILFNHLYCVVLAVTIVAVIVYLLFHWRFLCTNLEPQQHVKKLCQRYQQNEVYGDLCLSLCVTETIHSVSCHAFHAGKEIVFSAQRSDKSRLVFKSARYDDVSSLDGFESKHFPTESQFQTMIMNHVKSRLNVTISEQQARSYSRFASGVHAKSGSAERHAEMREIWNLLQDSEYLLAVVFHDKDIFPKVIGSCGPYFAVEHVSPVMVGDASQSLSEEGGHASWAKRVHLAVLILDLLSDLDLVVTGGLHLCDVKPAHFGLSTRTGKLQFVDLDSVLPHAVLVDSALVSGGACRVDADCGLFDCRAHCDITRGKCLPGIANNNLQVVCEKIFLGWQISGPLIMPGLLNSQHTPTQLSSLLRQCADPDPSPHPSVHQRLTTTLAEIDKMLSATNYDYYDAAKM
ncbi:divergent protein kinase domain 1C isoform X2 [Nilaparvata lugens]|uniref:divergent protein kinase domain 1C isoform X2 n=1 Tax=Nilaparvata lugens TaxID=108931 RepID=UPI000B995FF3|nr:divergent protein kinase domain 1C isoform X2 [Nilaparvata lugens]